MGFGDDVLADHHLLHLSPGEWILALSVGFAALAYGLREALDLLGKSPRSTRLRAENVDLLRINRELTDSNIALKRMVDKHEGEIHRLQALVDELQKRDQRAVLDALAQHEVSADRRADISHSLLREIADALKS